MKADLFVCPACGHNWKAKTDRIPVSCPRCKKYIHESVDAPNTISEPEEEKVSKDFKW